MSDQLKHLNIRIPKTTFKEAIQNHSNKSQRVRDLIMKGQKYEDQENNDNPNELARFIRVPSWLPDHEVKVIQKGIDQYLRLKMQSKEDFDLEKVVERYAQSGIGAFKDVFLSGVEHKKRACMQV